MSGWKWSDVLRLPIRRLLAATVIVAAGVLLALPVSSAFAQQPGCSMTLNGQPVPCHTSELTEEQWRTQGPQWREGDGPLFPGYDESRPPNGEDWQNGEWTGADQRGLD